MRRFEKVKRIEEDIKLPKRATKKSAGYDFFAIEDVVIEPAKLIVREYIDPKDPGLREIEYGFDREPTMVPTGVKVKMLDDEYLMLVNRSSNPIKKSLVLANGVGIIDADYYNNPDNDGEMMFPFYNVSRKPVEIKKGDKLGQGIFMKYGITGDDDAEGERVSGFGSTGV